ncbi:Homoserine dehydrogenase [Entomophthora muscae]|uniref:Homoserine dehydrogenase n=1 Tax=Entomophthora muscae TaxID=34485 RepID=A0ACC2UC64_9FUNG|nr:Homoserine dehydrogenase [Entomophthora muscae]
MMNVGLIGVGLVGKELLSQIGRLNGVQVVGAMNSKRMILRSGVSAAEIEKLLSQLDQTQAADLQGFVGQFASSYTEGVKVLVDCTSDERVASCYPEWLKQGFHVVTPNKKAFSGNLSLYKEILAASQKYNRFCYHESTVGAGLPVVETLKSLVQTGDKIVKVEGIFSGTLSYLFNNFSSTSPKEKVSFSDIVKVAKEKGFTEPDPRDDLNGLDVARKVTILGRIAGLDISLETLDIENIVPEQLRSLGTASEFMSHLPEFDSHFDQLNSEAASQNQVLRYVGMIGGDGTGSVKLTRYSAEHPFASLTGSDNIVAFTTERFPSPLIIQGAGAGSSVTVFGILSDLLKIQERA